MVAVVPGTAATFAPPADTIPFTRAVANVEFLRMSMLAGPPREGLRFPQVSGAAWYGLIVRRLDADRAHSGTDHFVPFLAEYSGGVPTRAWCDTDLDGDLTDEPPVTLSRYAALEGARSFLAPLRWTALDGHRPIPIEITYRVVLEPATSVDPVPDRPPLFRLQAVFAMIGSVTLEGRAHHAFLFDGDGDGLYRPGLGDGLYVDRDDDGRIAVDPMGNEFGSFSVPFTLGGHSYKIVEVDSEGRSIALRDLGAAAARPPAPVVGAPPPDFTFASTDGRRERLADHRGHPVLVYFWSSTCRTCTYQADPLVRLYERLHPDGFEILAISYDTDRAAQEAFRAAHRQTWPTSFSGRAVWEDPVGRLYRERGTGVFYLVDGTGRLALRTASVDAVAEALGAGVPAAAATPATAPD